MDIETRKYLTEKVLGECWHKTDRSTLRCIKCGIRLNYFNHRTFNSRNDLLDLYEATHKDGKWEPLYEYLRNNYLMGKGTDECISSGLKAWLICLSGEGYEDRCKMVSEFYGWEGKCL